MKSFSDSRFLVSLQGCFINQVTRKETSFASTPRLMTEGLEPPPDIQTTSNCFSFFTQRAHYNKLILIYIFFWVALRLFMDGHDTCSACR